MKSDPFDYHMDYDEYIASTPLEARFDYQTIQILVTEGIPRHAAYRMAVNLYADRRDQFAGSDTSEKKRLSFYLPLFPAMMSAHFATVMKLSYNRYLVSMIELGFIIFMEDYKKEYSAISEAGEKLPKLITSPTRKSLYLQLDKQTINLGSCVSSRSSKTKHFTPTVPDWIYNAVMEKSAYLNMSATDFCYLCWCLGTIYCLPSYESNALLNEEISVILSDFNTELGIYTDRILNTISKINACW